MSIDNRVEGEDLYTVRRDGQIVAQSHLVNLGYQTATLRALSAAGYAVYCDGKRVKIK